MSERDQIRSRRKREQRAVTISVRRGRKVHLSVEDDRLLKRTPRPLTRADCERLLRPCPFVSCRYHLYLDVDKRGSIKLNFPDIEPADMVETCSLDVADLGGESLEIVGEHLNITRERVRQIELVALESVTKSKEFPQLTKEYVDDFPVPENAGGRRYRGGAAEGPVRDPEDDGARQADSGDDSDDG